MAPGLGARSNKSAKEVFDEIAGSIQRKAHSEALTYENELHGLLTSATYPNDTSGTGTTPSNPCELDYNFHTNVTSNVVDPCQRRSKDRFSDVLGGQSKPNNIRDSTSDNVGACAPYRRLHVCDRNLEQIDPQKITTTHNLLVDVCLAAKFEGQSITGYYPQYEEQYPSSGSTMCTMLARSFADIGDIIRGKDLYIRNKKKDKLEDNLKEIFGNIYEGLTTTNGKNGKKSAKEHYKKDKETGNYYQLREDWWALNRKDVWEALTCEAPNNAKYFRGTCGGDEKTATITQCRCVNTDVPTNFDYIPQYLRWFEEWSEEFCRKRKKKLENAKKFCRGENGTEKYCSLNGYDCTQTVRKINKYRWDRDCTGCFFSCSHFKKWIQNEKNDFKRQKEKYNKEINEKGEGKVTKEGTINNIYAKKFYEQLQRDYGSTEAFLNLLNNEKICYNHPMINGKNSVNFTENIDNIFSHTEICEPCPWCGLKDNKDGTWRRLNENAPECPPDKKYEPPTGVTPTKIDVLQKEKGHDIIETLTTFCSTHDNKNIQNEKWKCYYESTDNEQCIMEKKKDDKNIKMQKPFYDFFQFWVTHMLKDSIEWRSKLSKCLKTDKKQCVNKCNSNCKCYERWVKKKQDEWTQIKEHFGKQKGFGEVAPSGAFGHYFVLEKTLEDEFLDQIKAAYGNSQEVERIKGVIAKKPKKTTEDFKTSEDIIEILLKHEEDEADLCLDTHEKDEDCSDDEDDHEEPPIVKSNPCGGQNGRKYPVLANEAAYQMHEKAKTQLSSRAGRSKLKADASEGTYKDGFNGNKLDKGNICNIDKNHSNATGESKNPCHGKGDGLQIGDTWNVQNSKSSTFGVHIRPRREHFCTSNLEFLETNNRPLDGTDTNDNPNIVNDSFLGDVLLSANREAEYIKKRYENQPGYKDEATMCRAIKYSFADLADIIKGTDLWDKNGGEKTTQGNLVTIFGKIKKELPGEIQERYTNRENKHLDLRKDWWEANRHQVWKAMKCHIGHLKDTSGHQTPSSHCGYNHGTPLDDYIPQRLRWMTEWAEWYCKMQSHEYDTLQKACKKCKGKGSGKECWKDDSDCTPCSNQCKEYGKNIKKWQEQWKQMDEKYQKLYLQAQHSSAGTVLRDDDPDYQLMVDFFKELQKANGVNTPTVATSSRAKRDTSDLSKKDVYSSAEGYIHQELQQVGCNTQTEFCKNGSGEKYAFKEPPDGYDEACKCDKNERPPPPPMTCVERAAKSIRQKAQDNINNNLKANVLSLNGQCDKINKVLLDEGNGSIKIIKTKLDTIFPLYDEFQKKRNNPFKIGEGWKCHNVKIKEKHICLPPRRENMYVKKIKDMTSRNVSNKKELLEGIMTAAQHEGINILKTHDIKDGKNLYDICNAMKYSFADISDIIRGRDLWNRDQNHKRIESKLKLIFENIYNNMEPQEKYKYNDLINHYKLRSDWWDTNRKDIWNAMTCNAPDAAKFLKKDTNDSSGTSSSKGIFSNDPKCGHQKDPPDYDYIPQPFRWMQEWSEYYCKLLNEEMEQFEKTCGECKNESNKCKNNIEKCNKCRDQCKNYKKLVNEWKDQIAKHDFKYKELYDKSKENENSGGFLDDYTKQFIEQMKEQCNDPKHVDEYLDKANNCLNFTFREGNKKHEKYAFTEPPKDYVNACNCDPTDLLHECPFENGNENACKSISTDNICKEKIFNVDLEDWNSRDIPDSTSKNNGVLVPPRRRQLCLQNITSNLNSIQNKDDFKKNLIQAAYTEAYFLREKYVNNEKAIQAMKYSFYDYGDIVKGTDMLDNYFLNKLKKKIDEFLRENDSNNISDNRKKWWIGNKNRVWYAMLCGYNKAGGEIKSTECVVPKEDEQTPQFLRWFQEWIENFCSTRKELYEKVQKLCESANCDKKSGRVHPETCKTVCEQYRNYISKKKQEYQYLNYQYNKNFMKEKGKGKNAPEYYKDKCNNKCNCFSEYFNDSKKWENPYETLGNETLKGKCDCQKTEAPPERKTVPDVPSPDKKEIPPVNPAETDIPPPPPLAPSDESILQTTIPFGVALALGSIAFFFMK
ncbi:hypothetical protein PFMC_01599, partial [Plasmodium falciparum CAMP/Malaysia]